MAPSAEEYIARYARLGISEYFVYDRARNRLEGYRLASPQARVYSPIVAAHGLYESRVLGLDLRVEQDRLRFYDGTALLLEQDERIERLRSLTDEAQRRAEEEARLREEETRRREAAEEENARLRAELERLAAIARSGGGTSGSS